MGWESGAKNERAEDEVDRGTPAIKAAYFGPFPQQSSLSHFLRSPVFVSRFLRTLYTSAAQANNTEEFNALFGIHFQFHYQNFSRYVYVFYPLKVHNAPVPVAGRESKSKAKPSKNLHKGH